MYDELGIGEIIDEVIEQDFEARQVSIGEVMKGMVRHFLAFINQPLYLFPKGKGIKAEHLNEHIMVRALDDIYELILSNIEITIL